MKKIVSFIFICFVVFLLNSKVSAQTLDFSDFKMTPDIVKTVTLNDGLKGSFCPVDLGITGQELLDSNIRDENFKLPDNIQGAPCKGNTEDVILAMVNVGFTKPVQGQNSVGLLLTLFKDHLFQQNGHGRSASAYYPNTPQTFSTNFLNGGEEGNTPPLGNPKWLKYEMDRDFLEMDSSSKEGFKTNPDSGYIIHFDPEGKRLEFLFIFEGRIYKLVKAEKKTFNTVILDYSQRNTPSSESNPNPTQSSNVTNPVNNSDVITISNVLTYMNQKISYSITMPKAGGEIRGAFSGICSGSINGQYSGGEGGSILGRAFGECGIAFIHQPIDISYTGTIRSKDGKADIDWLSHSGVTGENHGSFTQNFIPQSNTTSSSTSDVIIISSNLNYKNQSADFNITMPKIGGDISGNFKGMCNGSINGHYDGGEGGFIIGRAFGSCDIDSVHQSLNISYTGKVRPKEGQMDIDWLSHDGVTGESNGSFTQNFIPQH